MKNRVAIIGFGFMGQMHAQVYRALEKAELVAVVDTDAKALDQVRKLQLPGYASLAELFQKEDVDVIDVCLPTDLHAQAVIAAANAGKHVFCEKPFALTVAEGERALSAVEKNGVTLQVGQCIRFWPEYQALERFIAGGTAGKLVSLSLQRRASRPLYSRENWLQNGARSKGAALDLHIHDTDFILHLLGKPSAVHSIGRADADGAFSHIFTHYVYPDIAVSAEGGWDYPEKWGFQMAFQAVFERAVVDFDSSGASTLHVTEENKAKIPLSFEKPQIKGDGSSGGNISDLGGYFNELEYFVNCLSEGKRPEVATGAQALESLRVTLAEIHSAAERREVVLK